jgi:hypothetical protein
MIHQLSNTFLRGLVLVPDQTGFIVPLADDELGFRARSEEVAILPILHFPDLWHDGSPIHNGA